MSQMGIFMRNLPRTILALTAVSTLWVYAEDNPKVVGSARILSETDCPCSEYGEVTQITKDNLTISLLEVKNHPKMTFNFHSALSNGGVCQDACDATAYRLSDIKVGDRIVVYGYREKSSQKDFVALISLRFRPRGVIPPSQKPDEKKPYHVGANARQNWELYGVRMSPEHINERYRGVHPPPPNKVELREKSFWQ
jgi:hypothetical protein